ncbi:MAG: cobalamin biosynthesis protein CbiD [Lachnospiraceae bacterium]|nr:cobalamin biosynthesis protein CbiD [Lachnospiraceae bacterium]
MGQYLRSGYTTGICAAAAAKAAAVFLLTGRKPEKIEVCLEQDKKAEFYVEYLQGDGSWCRVRKDAGDDPDVTNGVWVYGGVLCVDNIQWEKLCRQEKGYVLEEYPGLYLTGGPGIGVVTKPGLSCPTGHYAINPAPRSQILGAVDEVRKKASYEGRLEVCVAVPDGFWLAQKTFNPRLGIVGGISVLGTTGIVKPMSEEALMETIRLEIRMKAAAGEQLLLLTPGNYGEMFLLQEMNITLGEAVRCSNFVKDSVKMAVEEGFHKILLAGHIGKLVKVAGGAENTHSKYGDGRMEEMERLTMECVNQTENDHLTKNYSWEKLFKAVRRSNTTEESIGILKEAGLDRQVLSRGAEKVKRKVEQWGEGELKAEVIVFSSAHKVMGKTRNADEFIQKYSHRKENLNGKGVL